MPGVREFLNTTGGKATAVGLIVLGIAFMLYSLKKNFGQSEIASTSRERIFVDAKTGKSFEYTVSASDRIPIKAPSGGNKGYPAGLGYWTKDGKVKKEPTAGSLTHGGG